MEKNTITLAEMITNDIDSIALGLQKFLVDNGITPPNSKITTLVNEIEKLKVMKVTKKYAGIIVDENGYVVRAIPIVDFMDISTLPADIAEGYYKIINGTIVLDEERQRQLEEV